MPLVFRKSVVKNLTIIFLLVTIFSFSAKKASAAISVTTIAQAANTTDATTQVTTSFTPVANRLYLMWTVQTIGATPPTTPTVTCANGLTMNQVATRTFSTNTTPLNRITLFRGLITTAGTNSTCTISWGQTALSYAYAIVGFDGVDTSGTDGSGAIVQSAVDSTDNAPAATGLSIALSPILSGSASAGGFSNIDNNGSALTPGVGYTANTLVRQNNNPITLRAEWAITGSAIVNMTQRLVNNIGGIAVEIRQPAAATISASPSTCTISSGASTCTVPFTWSISNAISPNLYNATTANTYSTSASGAGVSFAITNGSNTVQARDSSTVLASTSVTASCTSGTTWNGSICAPPLAVPTVTSPTATSITSAGATLGANVTSLGSPASISERGTCWGTSPSPLTNCLAEGGTTTGVFTQTRSGMSSSTLYYYRGYATNTTGTGYSADGTFTTLTVTGSVSASPSTCTISSGASTCTVPFTWSISNAISPNLYNATTANTYSTSASGAGVSFAITNGSNTVQARDSSTVLASTSVTASCTSGTTWNGSICSPIPDTTAPTPNPMTFASVPVNDSASQISMTATTASDATTPVTYLFTNNNTSCGATAGTGGTTSSWQTSTTYSDSGLDPNKCYGYTVTARDSVTPTPNTGTASSASSTYTSANTPGAPTLSGATATTLNLTNTENSNPASNPATYFAAQVVTTSPNDGTWLNQWVNASGLPSATAVWMTDAQLDALVLHSLQPGTMYGVKSKARNQDNDETVLSAEGQGTTLSAPTTSLGDGTTPSSVTIGPGDSVTDLDYFTLQTSTGSDTVTAVTATLLPAGAYNNISEVDITNDTNNTKCTSVTNPTSNTITFSSCNIAVTSTASPYKIRITPKTHALMPAVPGASYATTGTITSFTSTNVQANTDTTSATITIDNLSPNGATSESGSGGDTNVSLSWTSSNSSDFNTTNGSVVYRWVGASAGAEVPTEGSTATTGASNGTATVACVISSAASTPLSKTDGTGGSTGCTTTPLTNGQSYTYKVFQQDVHGNYDAGTLMGTFSPSAAPTVTLSTGTDPVANTIAPGAGATDVDYFTLQSNTGTESITSVTVNLSANSGTIGTLAVTDNSNTVLGSTTSPTVGSNTISVAGMSAGTSATTFKIRVTPLSHALMPAVPGAEVSITAPVTAWAGSYVHAGTDSNPNALTIDNLSPSNVPSASVTSGNTQVTADWVNPSDTDVTTDGTILVLRGTAAVIDTPTEGVTYTRGDTIGSSYVACVITGTPPATTCTDTGLTNGTSYHYKIFIQDSHGNYSASGFTPSNSPATPSTTVVPTFTISATAGAGGTILPAGNTSVAQGNSQTYVITPDSGYSISTLLVDGISVVPTTLYTFTNVQAAHTISVTFTTSSTVVVTAPGASRPTTVTFFGKAFPEGSVTIAKKFLSTENITGKAVVPSTDGSFNISFVGILQGLQSFGLIAKDKNGHIAQTKFFFVDTTSEDLLEKEILVPPTITVLSGQVSRGGNLVITGYASPNHSIRIYIDDIIVKEQSVEQDGSYKIEIPTGALSFGSHKVKARQIDPNTKTESDFSTSQNFIVSQLTVVKADFSGDGKIDIRDWSIFLSRWLSRDPLERESIDLTGDGKVDISDFSIFIRTIRQIK